MAKDKESQPKTAEILFTDYLMQWLKKRKIRYKLPLGTDIIISLSHTLSRKRYLKKRIKSGSFRGNNNPQPCI